MKLVVGLGNPGRRYLSTRHNIGATVIRAYVKEQQINFKYVFWQKAFIATIKKDEGIGGIIALPLVYMNLSGTVVSRLVKKNRINGRDLLIVHDDMDFPLGRIQVKLGGSSAGHNGIESIINYLGTEEFCRLRIGIGRPTPKTEPADYVLSPFTTQEQQRLGEVIEHACFAIDFWLKEGIDKTMAMINKRREGNNE
ncbi:MAG: aminoacyl-tRNA hydrolase [Candidatus Omnitrophica bacterium]|nr:aminoacyl-tRNA hydrolase [Candidatus Omnitrophota bacterium]